MCGKKSGLVGMVREKMREENCAGKDTAELREQKFLCELAFLCDISSHLDALNLQLQGRGRIITDMYAPAFFPHLAHALPSRKWRLKMVTSAHLTGKMGGQERICLKDIGVQVLSAPRRFMKIEKNPVCNLDAKKYQLISEPERDISPKKRKNGNRKTKALSDKQLLQVAETLGQEWEQAAIYLKLSITDLDNIKAERQTNVSMQKLKMLVLWKNRRPRGEATAQH
ncbi:hypothetical protein NHX12_017072 [Muraenolepis orangiensis]|uniref:Death domain-containing protein n=1 Tax=Muraenolepis orangiensis TaxID=630683 RepID=A0A9Q0I3D0_9TELE|nr:hypothetical protein NHX12_017072 [Muraenolepis orangiensis]